MVANTAFFAGGKKFETWKDWSLAAATYYLPPATADYLTHPTLSVPLAEGMFYYNTVSKSFMVYDGTDWIENDVGAKTISGQWQFDLMPTVGPSNVPVVPAGGTAGQQLAKIDGDNWNTRWVSPPSGTFDPNFDYEITGAWGYSTSLTLQNEIDLRGEKANAVSESLIVMDVNDRVSVGNSVVDTRVVGDQLIDLRVDGDLSAQVVTRDSGSLLVRDQFGFNLKVGFRNPIEATVGISRTFLQNDEGRVLKLNANGLTMTVDQLEAGTKIKILTDSNSGIQFLRGNIASFRYYDGSGTIDQSATKNIAGASSVELYWESANNVAITGNGIS